MAMTITPDYILQFLPKPDNTIDVLVEDNDTNDIIVGIIVMHNMEIENYNILGEILLTYVEKKDIPKFLYKFCKKYFDIRLTFRK